MTSYVSGQITGLPFEQAKELFDRAGALLKGDGHDVVNPLEVQACVAENCGDGSTLPGGAYFHNWHCYMKHDLKALLECDQIFMLPNWRESKGALIEHGVAVAAGIHVRYFNHKVDGYY